MIDFTFLHNASYGKDISLFFSRTEPIFERKNSPPKLASAEDKTYDLDELHPI